MSKKKIASKKKIKKLKKEIAQACLREYKSGYRDGRQSRFGVDFVSPIPREFPLKVYQCRSDKEPRGNVVLGKDCDYISIPFGGHIDIQVGETLTIRVESVFVDRENNRPASITLLPLAP